MNILLQEINKTLKSILQENIKRNEIEGRKLSLEERKLNIELIRGYPNDRLLESIRVLEIDMNNKKEVVTCRSGSSGYPLIEFYKHTDPSEEELDLYSDMIDEAKNRELI